MTLCSYLGYSDDALEPFLSGSRLEEVNSLLAQLAKVDLALNSASLDSMAVSVGELKVSYGQHLAVLKAEGSRLLRVLSHTSGLPILYNRYTGKYTDLADLPIKIRRYIVDNQNLSMPYFVGRDEGVITPSAWGIPAET